MTATTLFLLAALGLIAAVLAILLPPLLRSRQVSGKSGECGQSDATRRILRDQLAELEREHDEGLLNDAAFALSRQELQRRLLDEIEPAEFAELAGAGEPPAPPQRTGRKTALALLVLVPLAAAAGYGLLGTPQALTPHAAEPPTNVPQIDAMLGKLVARLKAHPDDAQGWAMLARSYRVLGRFAESADAYSHAGALVDSDPVLLADYAEVSARANDGRFAGQPDELIGRALTIDPDEPHALFLAGASATDREDFPAVVEHWSRLLRQMEAGSEESLALEKAIAKARELTRKAKQ